MKRIIFITLLIFSTFSIYSINKIDRLMVSKAESPREKEAVYEYLLNVAHDKRLLAERFKQMAKTGKGGKAQASKKHRKEMLEEAKQLEKEALSYEKLAKSIER